MQHKIILGAATMALLGAGALAYPQNEKPQGDKPMPRAEKPMGAHAMGAQCNKTSEVIGAKVMNTANAKVGKVEDLVLDPATGRIDYAVLSLETKNGKDQWFAIPFQKLTMPMMNATDAKKRSAPEFTLDVDAAKLDAAPGFPKDKWPDVTAMAWRTDLDKYYGARAAGDMPANGDVVMEHRAVRASKLLDENVKNKADEKVGEIEELVIDPSHARINYVVVSTGGFLGMGEKMHAIPWQATEGAKMSKDDNVIVMDVTKERLKNAPEFKKDEWVRMSDPAFSSELYTYYGYRPYWSDSEMKARDGKPTPASGERTDKDKKDPH